MHTLAIITVIYENYSVFDDFLKSLLKQESSNFHLYVVDASIHKQELAFGNLSHTLIESENNGYADGVNQGIKAALEDGITLFCVMNYDTYFEKNFVSSVLASILKHPQSIIGGKIYYAPGYEYHKDRYVQTEKGKVIWYAGGTIDWRHAVTPHTGVDEVDKGQFDQLTPVGFITGCLMCFDKDVVNKVGYWSTDYFLYYEDADYCARAVQKGVPLIFDPSIVIWHKVSQTTQGSGSAFHQTFQNRNRVRFGLKYAPLRTKVHLLKNIFFDAIKTK